MRCDASWFVPRGALRSSVLTHLVFCEVCFSFEIAGGGPAYEHSETLYLIWASETRLSEIPSSTVFR